MGVDRWIRWKEDDVPDWGRPTIDRIAQTARDFLGPSWTVRISARRNWIICETQAPQRFHLRSEFVRLGDESAMTRVRATDEMFSEMGRGFEICFFGEHGEEQFSVITRQADRFTNAVADELTRIIAQWWHGDVEWPT